MHIVLQSHIHHFVHCNKLPHTCSVYLHLLSCRHQSASNSGSGSGPGVVNVRQLFVGWSLVEAKVLYFHMYCYCVLYFDEFVLFFEHFTHENASVLFMCKYFWCFVYVLFVEKMHSTTYKSPTWRRQMTHYVQPKVQNTKIFCLQWLFSYYFSANWLMVHQLSYVSKTISSVYSV